MKLIAFALAVISSSAFSAELVSGLFQEWLDDADIAVSKQVSIVVALPFDQVEALKEVVQKVDPKVQLDEYLFRRRLLKLDTTKAGTQAIVEQAVALDVVEISNSSDLGTLDATMSEIRRIRDQFEEKKIEKLQASKLIRDALNGEFNLKRTLSKNDILALGAGLLSDEFRDLRSRQVVEKVRYGYSTGLEFLNEVDVYNGNAPPADTKTHAYVKVNTFPIASGSVTTYREVKKIADAKDYILAAKLPKGYEYKVTKASTNENPQFELTGQAPAEQ